MCSCCGRLGRGKTAPSTIRSELFFRAPAERSPFLAAARERVAARLWEIGTEVAQRLGFRERRGLTSCARPADDFFSTSMRRLSAFENDVSRDFDLGGLAARPPRAGTMTMTGIRHRRRDVGACQPVEEKPSPNQAKRASSASGAFFHEAMHAVGRFHCTRNIRAACWRSSQNRFFLYFFPPPENQKNTRAPRDHGITMTRSGKSPRLGAHSPNPLVDNLDSTRIDC